MKFNVFTLHPNLFGSFCSEALIARAIAGGIIDIETVNWREKYGVGGYKQVDDRPYGGGTGMVLQADPIFSALQEYNAVSPLFQSSENSPREYSRAYPRNDEYYDFWSNTEPEKRLRSVTISMTPRGYQFNQQVAEWISNEFDIVNVVCGRYEGFDSRASELFDLELSMGPYVVNGGEVPAMTLIEAVARLVPDFVTKNPSVLHDSFSSELNQYQEMDEYVVGTRRKKQLLEVGDPNNKLKKHYPSKPYVITRGNTGEKRNLFDKAEYMSSVAPFIEHPQFTRPQNWMGFTVPDVLLKGDHKSIQAWRGST